MFRVEGMLVVGEHCRFRWVEHISTAPLADTGEVPAELRIVHIEIGHCDQCVDRLLRLAARDGFHVIDERISQSGRLRAI